MSKTQIDGARVGFLVARGFEQDQVADLRDALRERGARTELISPDGPEVRSWAGNEWGSWFAVDRTLDGVTADAYDALIVPSGVVSRDRLRHRDRAATLVGEIAGVGKPLAAIGAGTLMLGPAGVAEGRRLTSDDDERESLESAGATWVDETPVRDENVITARSGRELDRIERVFVDAVDRWMRARPRQTPSW